MSNVPKRILGDNSKRWQPCTDEQRFWKFMERASILIGIVVSIVTIFRAVTDSSKNLDNDILQQTEGDGYIAQAGDRSIIAGDGSIIMGDGSTIVTNVEGTTEHTETDNEMGSEGQALLAMLEGQTLSDQLAGSTDLIRKKFYSEAVQLLTEMLKQEIDGSKMLAAIYYNRGVAYCYLENYGLAQEDFYKSLSNMKFADAYYSLGAASAALARKYEESASGDPFQEYARAINNYSFALELEESVEYYLARAAAYEAIGATNNAISDYQMVLSLDKENKVAGAALKRII